MQDQTTIWIAAFAGSLLYFVFKARKAMQDASAANLSFNIGDYLKKDIVDILISLGITAFVLNSKEIAIPGFQIDLTNWFSALTTGIGISSIGVNLVLGLFGFGDKYEKEVRNVVDEKTNIADAK